MSDKHSECRGFLTGGLRCIEHSAAHHALWQLLNAFHTQFVKKARGKAALYFLRNIQYEGHLFQMPSMTHALSHHLSTPPAHSHFLMTQAKVLSLFCIWTPGEFSCKWKSYFYGLHFLSWSVSCSQSLVFYCRFLIAFIFLHQSLLQHISHEQESSCMVTSWQQLRSECLKPTVRRCSGSFVHWSSESRVISNQ